MVELRERNPYVGPRPFEREDQGRFFGRDRESRTLRSLVIAHAVVLLYGPSGAGKTSLLNAALFPLLEQEEFQLFPVARVGGVPGGEVQVEEDREATSNLYVSNTLASWGETQPNRLTELSLREFLAEREHSLDETGLPAPRVVVFDQFEEVFSSYPGHWRDRRTFFEQVRSALDADPLLRVIFAMRQEYIAQLDPYAAILPHNLRTRFHLERMNGEAALKAVQGPLAGTDRSFASGVAEELVAELQKVRVETASGETVAVSGEFVEPVQLQVVCRRLWQDLPADVVLVTRDHLQDFGNVNEALADFYDRTVSTASRKAGIQEGDLRIWLEQNLITPAGTRGSVYRGVETTGGIDNEAVEALENLHLIRGERRAGARWYELTHDRFIDPIRDSNTAWFPEPLVETAQARQRLKDQAAEWSRLGRGNTGLLDQAELHEAQRWLDILRAARISAAEEDDIAGFIQASRQALRRRTQIRVGAGVLAVVLVVTAVAVYAWLQATNARQQAALRQQAEDQLALASSRQMAATARDRLGDGDPQAALWLGVAAATQITKTTEAVNVLRDALTTWRGAGVLEGHAGRVGHVIFSPNAQYLASISADRPENETADPWQIHMWQMLGQRRVLVFNGHDADITSAAFTPDSRLLVTASHDGYARAWDVVTGEMVHEMEHPDNSVWALGMNPDGTILATGTEHGDHNRRVWLWDLTTGDSLLEDPCWTDGQVTGLTFSPDGSLLAVADAGRTPWIYRVSDAEVVARLHGHDGPVRAIAFSPDGRFIATASEDRVRMWRVPSDLGEPLPDEQRLPDQCGQDQVNEPPNRDLFRQEGDELVDLANPYHGGDITSLAFSTDGRYLATGSQDATAKIWNLTNPSAAPTILQGHAEQINAVAFSPDGQVVATTSLDDTARLWWVDSGRLETILADHTGNVWSAAVSPDGEVLATSDDTGVVRLWRLPYTTGFVPATRVIALGERTAVIGEDGGIELWHLDSDTVEHYRAGDSRLDAIAVSADGMRLAVGDVSGRVHMLDAASGEVQDTWQANDSGGVRALVFTRDGARLASAGASPTIRLWDATNGELQAELHGHGNDVNALALGADPTTLVSASGDGTVRLWNLDTREVQQVLDAEVVLLTVAFNPDANSLAAAGYDSRVRVLNLDTSEWRDLSLPGATNVRAVAWSRDGNWLAAGDEEGMVSLWDWPTRQQTRFRAYTGAWVSGLAFSAGQNRLVTTSRDGDVRVWPVETADLVNLACQRAGPGQRQAWWPTFGSDELSAVCQDVVPASWAVASRLDAPQPASPALGPPAATGPIIHYFEAEPGSLVRPDGSATLRWRVEGATGGVYLEYGGEEHGQVGLAAKDFSPAEDTTYRLIARGDDSERTLDLTIRPSDE